ncbi:MAG TPA: hypothetical protein VJ824_02220 [Bacillota bacterium]|nr:hypothetical protein [Bacillota bacterium]
MNWYEGLIWGKVIDEFNFQQLHQIMEALIDKWFVEREQPVIVIGYDTRFQSDVSARVCAQLLATKGIKVYLAKSPIPLGSLLLDIHRGQAYGMMITGGPRAIEYNGIRLLYRDGTELTSEEWAIWRKNLKNDPSIELYSIQEAVSAGTITFSPLYDSYLSFLRQTIDCEQIKNSGVRIVFDSLYGSSQGIFKHLLFNENIEEIHEARHSMFGGLTPDLGEENIQHLFLRIRQENKHLGFLYDPEARHWILANGKSGKINKDSTFTTILEKIADKKDLKTLFPNWKRDGILCSLLLLEFILDS